MLLPRALLHLLLLLLAQAVRQLRRLLLEPPPRRLHMLRWRSNLRHVNQASLGRLARFRHMNLLLHKVLPHALILRIWQPPLLQHLLLAKPPCLEVGTSLLIHDGFPHLVDDFDVCQGDLAAAPHQHLAIDLRLL